jgi:hypothetical protein
MRPAARRRGRLSRRANGMTTRGIPAVAGRIGRNRYPLMRTAPL